MKMMKQLRWNLQAALAATVIFVAASAMAHAQEPAATDTAVITTSLGKVTLVLYGVDAPKTVENFVKLSQKGFYKGILFHRVVRGFVIQAGDPNTRDTSLRADWGKGGESIYGKPFEDELNPNAPSYKRGYVEGTLAMANRGPNTNTSQFFITLGNVTLPKNYTIFGHVVVGMEVVHQIEAAPQTDPRTGAPTSPVKILDVKVKHVKR